MPEVLDAKTLFEGWSTFRLIRFRMDDGSELERTVEHHGDAACVLPYDPDRKVALLVRQFRAPTALLGEEPFPEPPAGIIDPGEKAEQSAWREAMEETGLDLKTLEPLGCFWSSPGSTTERSHLFLAAYCAADRTGTGGGVDDHEDIETLEVPLKALAARLDGGGAADLKLLSMVLSLRLRRPELFD